MTNQWAAVVSPDPARRLWLQVTVAALGRLLINTSRRFIYPYAPVIGRGLGLPLTSVTALIALNQVTGILSPIFGPLSDRWGYRIMMIASLGLMALGMLSSGIYAVFGVLLIGLFLAGLAKSIFDPALSAYIGEKVPYQRRGRVIGLVEMSWAGAALVGIPLVGLLIANVGWRAPFFVLGALGVAAAVILALIMPRERRKQQRSTAMVDFRAAWGQLRRERAALGLLAFGALVSMANDIIFVVYAAWFERSFNLGIVAIGTATTIIGIAELTGETLTATLSDRVGLKRAIIVGTALTTLSYLFLPFSGRTLALALAGLFFVFVSFEFSIVTSFSLATEILPTARATMLSAFVAALGLGRVVGALLGGSLWLSGGITAVGLASAVASALSLLVFTWGLHRWHVR
jgi:predicted MFS family arabinose efflux permease